MNIDTLIQYLADKGCILKGCSTREVAKIEDHIQHKLPLAYVKFLFAMGKDAGKFMDGSSVFYNEIFDLKDGAIELLEDNDFKPLPDNTFVFYMHQGYQFAFFYLTDGDDPPVYYYYEGRTQGDFEKIEVSFTDFLESQLIMSGLK